jgi:hypothetical protein
MSDQNFDAGPNEKADQLQALSKSILEELAAAANVIAGHIYEVVDRQGVASVCCDCTAIYNLSWVGHRGAVTGDRCSACGCIWTGSAWTAGLGAASA